MVSLLAAPGRDGALLASENSLASAEPGAILSIRRHSQARAAVGAGQASLLATICSS